MTYRGQIKGGVVVLEGAPNLPEGTIVTVQTESNQSQETAVDDLARMSELAVPTGISDLATNVDHYLYDHPKASNGD